MSAAVEPTRVVVSCVFDQNPLYRAEALLLYGSLIKFGGRLVEARRRAYSVGPLDCVTGRHFERLGVEVITVTPPIEGFPLANKLRMFEQRCEDEDVLLALDTDTVIAGDVCDWLQADAVAAKPVDHNQLSEGEWTSLYRHFDLEAPSVRFRTHFHHLLAPPYFNSGVICFPSDQLAGFSSEWEVLIDSSLGHLGAIDENLESRRYYAEQWSFALALLRRRLPYTALPLELNYPTHAPVHKTYESTKPLVMHHHHQFDNDGLLPAGTLVVDREIRRLNDGLSDFCRNVVWPLRSSHMSTSSYVSR